MGNTASREILCSHILFYGLNAIHCFPMLTFFSSLSEMISQNVYELQKRSLVFSLVLKIQLFPKNRNACMLGITRLEPVSQQI